MSALAIALHDAVSHLEDLQKKAFGEEWAFFTRSRMIATLQSCLLSLQNIQGELQTIRSEVVREKKPDYLEQNLLRIQETSQFLERNLLFEKSLTGKPEDDNNPNETFAALQEKLQQLVANIQMGLQKTNLSVELSTKKEWNREPAGESVTSVLKQKENELNDLKQKLQQLEMVHLTHMESGLKPEVVEKRVFETAKKIEWHVQSLKQADYHQEQSLAAWDKSLQEKRAILSMLEENIPKFLSESMLAMAGLQNEINELKHRMHLQQEEWQRLHEKNIREITRLHEERAGEMREIENRNRAERKKLLDDVHQKNEMIQYFQQKQHEHEVAYSKLLEEVQAKNKADHVPKEKKMIPKKKTPKKALKRAKVHAKK